MMRARKTRCAVLVSIILLAAEFNFGQRTPAQANKTARRLAEFFMSQPDLVNEARTLEGHCDETESQLLMNACWTLEFEGADEQLNSIYKSLLAKLDSGQTTTLHKIQRTWVRYRDLHCDATAARYKGGSMQPAVLYSCWATLTRARIKDIESSYAFELE